jgi:predicted PurR-regulated permease PerM
MGHTLELHPGLVIVALLAALALTGLLGALLIVPILATGKVIGRYLYNRFILEPNKLALPSVVVTVETNEVINEI